MPRSQETAQAAWARARMASSVRISDAAFTMFFSDAATCMAARGCRCNATAEADKKHTAFQAEAGPQT